MDTFSHCIQFLQDMKHAISARWLANLNRGLSHFPRTFGAHMNILSITKVKILVLIEWSYSPPPPNYVHY